MQADRLFSVLNKELYYIFNRIAVHTKLRMMSIDIIFINLIETRWLWGSSFSSFHSKTRSREDMTRRCLRHWNISHWNPPRICGHHHRLALYSYILILWTSKRKNAKEWKAFQIIKEKRIHKGAKCTQTQPSTKRIKPFYASHTWNIIKDKYNNSAAATRLYVLHAKKWTNEF